MRRRLENFDSTIFWLSFAIALLSAFTIGVFVSLWFSSTAHARNDGRYDQTDGAIRQWFRAQLVPRGERKGTSCCSTADATQAQEEIRKGVYWVRFVACDFNDPTKCVNVDWQPVDEDSVLDGPNPRGVPIVWWYFQEGKFLIRCFSPGPKV